MNKPLAWIGTAIAACAIALAGCGDDDDDAVDSGVAGSGGASGAGGSGSGGMGAGGGGGTMAPAPIDCGPNKCNAPAGIGGLLGGLGGGALPMAVACCLPDDSCGTTTMTGGTCEARAKPDSRCPSITGLLAVAGCCTADNQCGVDGMLLGRGCVENAAAKAMLGQLSAIAMVPAPKACDAPVTVPDAGAGDDAGKSDVDAGQ
jgi:hypothetical protein